MSLHCLLIILQNLEWRQPGLLLMTTGFLSQSIHQSQGRISRAAANQVAVLSNSWSRSRWVARTRILLTGRFLLQELRGRDTFRKQTEQPSGKETLPFSRSSSDCIHSNPYTCCHPQTPIYHNQYWVIYSVSSESRGREVYWEICLEMRVSWSPRITVRYSLINIQCKARAIIFCFAFYNQCSH